MLHLKNLKMMDSLSNITAKKYKWPITKQLIKPLHLILSPTLLGPIDRAQTYNPVSETLLKKTGPWIMSKRSIIVLFWHLPVWTGEDHKISQSE
jgi:hypothetical protein